MNNQYPSNWTAIRQQVLTRDNYECQQSKCDARGGPHGDKELHVHHVIPLSEGGSHQLENLKTLCQDCHSEIHGWDIGGSHESDTLWVRQNGDDLLICCWYCDEGSIVQRNQETNLVICDNCGKYKIPDDRIRQAITAE